MLIMRQIRREYKSNGSSEGRASRVKNSLFSQSVSVKSPIEGV